MALAVTLVAPASAFAGGDHDGHDGHRVVVHEGESIQAAVDAAKPHTKIIVRGDHVEQVFISKSHIELVGKHASLTLPEDWVELPSWCGPTLICVSPVFAPDGFPAPEDFLTDVSVEGFDLTNPIYDAIGTYFTNDVEIERNTAKNPGCDGVFVLFATGFVIERNSVWGSANCGGIEVAASSHGKVSRNTTIGNMFNGIAINDTSNVWISRNNAFENCIGIGVADGDDQLGLGSENVTIRRNKANRNNSICYPFDPPGSFTFPVGATGILVAGVQNVDIVGNRANHNVTDEFSITAAGIFVADFPNPDGTPFSITNDATVVRNKSWGNMSAVGPADLFMPTEGVLTRVARNRCG
jgi:hypothetical protein